MTTRTVAVRLLAVTTQFSTAMKAAGRDVADVQAKIAAGDQGLKRNQEQVSRGMLLVGGAAVAAAGLAVKAFAGFDKSMSNVKAVSGATADQMDTLREAALEAGKATVFSASEAADAEAELAKAGVSTADILGGALRGSLDLAAAGQLELADAATISAQAMNIFKLRGADVTHIADVLAAGANKSAADVKGLGDALRQGGLVAAQTGAGLEETVGTLSAFADSALIGSDAGTSLKTMMQRLTPDTEKAASAMEQIGLDAFDAQGNFIGLEAVAGQLEQGLGKLTAEERARTLEVIFGADAQRAANVLYEQGAAGLADYTRAVNDQGAATRMASTQLDNLSGDLEAFRGSVETALIQSGSKANGALRGLTQAATGMVNAFSDAPGVVQTAVTGIAGIGGAALIAVGGIGTLAPKIKATRDALDSMGAAGQYANKGMTAVGKGVGIAAAAFVAYEAATAFLADSASDLQRFTEEIEAGAGTSTAAKISALRAEMVGLKEESNEGWLNGEIFGYGVRLETGAYKAGNKVFALQDRIKALRHEQKLQDLAAGGAAASTEEFGGAVEAAIPVVEEAEDAIGDYKNALDALNGVNISAARQQIALREAVADATEAIDGSVKVTDDETSALLDLADQANQTASAIADQTGSQDKSNAALREARRRFIETATEMGHTRKEARQLADQWLAIPTKRQTRYSTPGLAEGLTDLERLRRKILDIPTTRSVAVTVNTINKLGGMGLLDGARATGGPVTAGRLYRVNETGVELFRPSVNGSIVPAGPTAGVLAAARSGSAMSGAYGGVSGGGSSTSTQFMRDLVINASKAESRALASEAMAALRRATFEQGWPSA